MAKDRKAKKDRVIVRLTKKEKISVIVKSAVAMLIFVLALINYDYITHIDFKALGDVTDNLWELAFIFLGVYCVKAVLFVVPASAVYLAVGALFPTLAAVAVNLTGILLELSITYLMGYFLGSELVNKLLSKSAKGQKVLNAKVQDKRMVLFSTRFLPVFPIDTMSLVFGSGRVMFPRYLLYSFLGYSPRVIAFTILGDAVFKLFPPKYIITAIIICIPFGVAGYLIKRFIYDPRHPKKNSSGNAAVDNKLTPGDDAGVKAESGNTVGALPSAVPEGKNNS